MPHETTAPYLTLGPLLRDPCLGSTTYGADMSAADVDADADELAEAQLENLFLHIRHGLPNGIVHADWLQQGTLDRDSACFLACGLHPVFWAHGGGLPAYAQPSLLLAQVELLRHRAQQAGREVDTPQGWLHWFQQLAPLLGGALQAQPFVCRCGGAAELGARREWVARRCAWTWRCISDLADP